MKGLILSAFIMLSIGYCVFVINANFEYKKISAHWDLADRSSTIAEKIIHIDNFVEALESQNLQGRYSVLFLKTEENSFDANFAALKSLQERLHEIKDMPVTSFEYQTAMQQITGQEQGEASPMLGVLIGAWFLNYSILLNPIVTIVIIIFLLVGLMFGWGLYQNQE